MGYMVRLGLWGPGTSFNDFREFLGWFVSPFYDCLHEVDANILEYSIFCLPTIACINNFRSTETPY